MSCRSATRPLHAHRQAHGVGAATEDIEIRPESAPRKNDLERIDRTRHPCRLATASPLLMGPTRGVHAS